MAVPVADKPAVTQKAGAPVKVTSVEGITEYRLANGLRVLLFPDASKPTLTTNVVYQVGSRHENYGETGMAHLLEHLLFKPSKNFGDKPGSKTPVELMNKIGAEFNGTTWFDRTNYFATFPASEENLNAMLAMEADRMVNARIAQKDLWNEAEKKGEMTVVRNEFERGESDPLRVTIQRIEAVAFDWHNYGKSTIGARSDIEQVNIERLRAFYQRYYQPDNAVLIVAGRMDEAKTLAKINEIFGKIPKPTRVLAKTYTEEPTQDGERAVTVRRSGGIQFVGVGYHTPPSSHVDDAALSVLGHILSDAPSGRLHKALVEAKLATRVFDYGPNFQERGYHIFGAMVAKDGNLDATTDAMLKVLEDLKSQPITEEEVKRAKTAIQKSIDLAMNDTAQLSIALTDAMAVGDWRLFFIGRDLLDKVDAKAVQAAAEKYLKPANRTVGRFIPTDKAERAEIPGAPDVAAMVKDYKGRAVVAQGEVFDPTPANIEKRVERISLPSGMKGALLPKKTKGEQVSAIVTLRLGSEASLMNKATIGSYAASLLMRGTETKSRQEIKDSFDKLKAQVNIGGSAEGVSASITTTRANLPAVLDLVAEVLRKPAFAEKEFDELKREAVARAEQALPEPGAQAGNALSRMFDSTPAGHVRHARTLTELVQANKDVKLDDVKAFHKAFYGAHGATFAVVGDFDAAALKAQMGKLFGDWKGSQPYARIHDTRKPVAASKQVLETPDKANSVLYAAISLPLRDDAPDYAALEMANHLLGGGALRSRLADRIRQKEGLSYGVGSRLQASDIDPDAMWMAYAISAPQNAAKVEAALRDELAKAIKDGFTDDELKDGKSGWLKAAEVNRTEDSQLARTLSSYLNIGRTMAYDKDLDAKIAGLSKEQVKEALAKYLKPEQVSVIMAGDFAKAAKDAPAK
nr:pitrilysin family protein [Massilia sp. TS11]